MYGYVTLCYYVNHCAVITWIFTYCPCILTWIFVVLRKDWNCTFRIPRLILPLCFEENPWVGERKMVVVVVEKERKGDLVWVEEEERKRVLVFNALTDICVTVYLSSKNILRFRLIFASCGNSGVWRTHTYAVVVIAGISSKDQII